MTNTKTETKDRRQLATARHSVGAASEVKPQAFGRVAGPALRRGFTIVELLVVIVVIAILATISVVAYNGVQNQAEETKLQADLRQAADQVAIDHALNDEYPPNAATVNEGKGFSPSDGTRLQYSANSDSYCLTATSTRRNVRAFYISSNTGSIREGVCDGHEGPSSGDGNSGDTVTATPDACFAFGSGTITDYYDNEGNNSANPTCSRDVVIPASIGGEAVMSIGSSAFRNNSLTSVTIPNSVTLIGSYAFRDNSLTSVTIPNSVTLIGSYAFRDNSLTSVTIPDSVTSIGSGAFYGNQLTSVTIPDSVTSIGSSVFSNNQLTSVTIPDSVTSIGSSAFYGNQLTSVTIPDSVTSIGTSAFHNNQLTSVTIPDSVTSIGNYAFYENPLATASVRTGTALGTNAFPSSTTVTWR